MVIMHGSDVLPSVTETFYVSHNRHVRRAQRKLFAVDQLHVILALLHDSNNIVVPFTSEVPAYIKLSGNNLLKRYELQQLVLAFDY
jgi:hypothetical protein